MRLLHRVAQHSLRPHDLAPAEFELLSALRIQEPPHCLTPSDPYDAMLMSSGGLTKILKGLEARGPVLRTTSNDDGRSRQVCLSEAGRAVAERAMASVQSAEGIVIREMTGEWKGAAPLGETFVTLAEAAERGGNET